MSKQADFKLLPPKTSDPDEVAMFQCQRCKKDFTSAEMDKHASRVHKLGIMVVQYKEVKDHR